MDIDNFFRLPGAPQPAEFARSLGVHLDQLRQWRYGYSNRRPGPEMCVLIERQSGGDIRRWDLRPDDWHRIWPELIGAEGAPSVPSLEEEARNA